MRTRIHCGSWLGGPCLLLVACRSTAPVVEPPPEPVVAPTLTPAPPTTERPAFVVLTATETLVVPLDPAVPVETLPGHWVGSPPGATPAAWGRFELEVTTLDDETSASLPVCPAGELDDACALPVELAAADHQAALAAATTSLELRAEVAADGALRWSAYDPQRDASCPCVVVHGLSTDGPPEPWIDITDPEVLEMIAMSPWSPEEYLVECSDDALTPALDPIGYLGGVLYTGGMIHNGVCSGLNLYDGAGEARPLRPGATEPTLRFPAPTGCAQGGPGDLLLTALDPDALDPDALDPDDACEASDELVTFALRRGRLVRATGSIDSVGMECACASWLPASPAVCPSPLDPCGHGQGLPSRDAWPELWVTNDERVALGHDAEGLAVLVPEHPEPIRRVPAVSGILGVEHHRDTLLLELALPPAIRVLVPPLHESDEGFEGAAKAWGNRCFVHLQAHRLDAAEAACLAGLLEGGTEGTRGALTYNLGRIAEARGDLDRARSYYQRSQGLRPHEATAERLRSLGGP